MLRFEKIFWWALIPQIGLLFYAVFIRISNYGITENCYLVVCFGVYLLGLALYFLFSKAKKLLVIPLCLSAIVVISSVGSWGAFRVSERSQMNRLEQLLVQNRMFDYATTNPASETIPAVDAREIMETTKYLYQRHKSKKLLRMFKDIPIEMKGSFYEFEMEFSQALNIKKALLASRSISSIYFSKYNQDKVLPLGEHDYDYQIAVSGYPTKKGTNIAFDTDKKLVLIKDQAHLQIKNKTQTLIDIDLKQKIGEKLTELGWDRQAFQKNSPAIIVENETVLVKIIVQSVGVNRQNETVDQLLSLGAIALIKIK